MSQSSEAVHQATHAASRYIGSLVGDFHRTLLYGGIYGYPGDSRNPTGKLRLLYECAPMSLIIEQVSPLCSIQVPLLCIVSLSPHNAFQEHMHGLCLLTELLPLHRTEKQHTLLHEKQQCPTSTESVDRPV